MIFKLNVQHFDPISMRSDKDDPPSGFGFARTHIVVASLSQDAGCDTIHLSAECRTASEVNYCADLMIKELEGIKRQAARMDWNNKQPGQPASVEPLD